MNEDETQYEDDLGAKLAELLFQLETKDPKKYADFAVEQLDEYWYTEIMPEFGEEYLADKIKEMREYLESLKKDDSSRFIQVYEEKEVITKHYRLNRKLTAEEVEAVKKRHTQIWELGVIDEKNFIEENHELVSTCFLDEEGEEIDL